MLRASVSSAGCRRARVQVPRRVRRQRRGGSGSPARRRAADRRLVRCRWLRRFCINGKRLRRRMGSRGIGAGMRLRPRAPRRVHRLRVIAVLRPLRTGVRRLLRIGARRLRRRAAVAAVAMPAGAPGGRSAAWWRGRSCRLRGRARLAEASRRYAFGASNPRVMSSGLVFGRTEGRGRAGARVG